TPPSITTASLPGGTVGAVYSTTLNSSGGTAPFSWSVSAGSLPAGLSLTAGNGVINGTPSAAGVSGFTINVTDNAGATASKMFSITIAAAPVIVTTTLPGGTS